LLIHEAGGIVSDSYGRPLGFGDGRTFKETTGVVATGGKEIHEIVIQAIQKVIKLEEAEAKDLEDVTEIL
jgi:3'(2'), 5'-bisphosphate nucleotidase